MLAAPAQKACCLCYFAQAEEAAEAEAAAKVRQRVMVLQYFVHDRSSPLQLAGKTTRRAILKAQ